jgi:hypothetical protein
MRQLLMFVIVAAAFGCGGDSPVSMAGAPAASSGRAGSVAVARGEVTVEECVVQTLGVFAVRPDGYPMACVECVCAQSPRTVALCDDQANLCWSLISCVADNCEGQEGLDSANCAIAMCGEFVEGSGLAMSLGALLQSDACSADCAKP